MFYPSSDKQEASLGDQCERYSVRLIQTQVHATAPKYLDEYMEVDKKDPQTGSLTRFILSEPFTFGIEITLNERFTYGSYDGVRVKLFSLHSGTMIWKKKFPKEVQKGPLRRARKFIIDSVEAIADGQLLTNANLSFDSLTDDDFLDPACSISQQDQQNLEGLRIELCKYKDAENTNLSLQDPKASMKMHRPKLDALRKKNPSIDTLRRTAVDRTIYHQNHVTHKLRFLNGKPATDQEIAQFLLAQAPCTRLCEHTDVQEFQYLWRGPKFFDTIAIAKTPVPLFRRPWDYICESYRQDAYAELSKYDYDYIWTHHLWRLGPQPADELVTALKDRLRSDFPPYWRSWGKLYGHEREATFRKLQVSSILFLCSPPHVDSSQERRLYIDKGEIPADQELAEWWEEMALDLEVSPVSVSVSPEKVNLAPGAVSIPTTTSLNPAEGTTTIGSTLNKRDMSSSLFHPSGLEIPQNTSFLNNPPQSISQTSPIPTAEQIPSVSSAQSKEVVGISAAESNTVTPGSRAYGIDNSILDTGLLASDDLVPAVVSPPQCDSPVASLPGVKMEREVKRPAEFIDLTIPKRRVHKKVLSPSIAPRDITHLQHSIQMNTNHAPMTGGNMVPGTASSPLMPPNFTRIINSPAVQSFSVDVDNYIPLRSFSAGAVGTETGINLVKRDPDAKCEVRVKDEFTLSSIEEDELRRLEEEAARAAIELEDAVRVAEARKQVNGVKRRIEQLRSRGRSFN
ncbi:hypothetical protein CJF32_00002680 [Rutstroemia sp. NJR-2017a WRK4]|nr:hypothetical protein CJF32_00006282 [Rutstroemia sp. NJR-2017a WRK4]PQE11891.1 hypothetical protein CJF32_00002680 [Rutstroemia sp. NJR-2017a WRK4]